MTDTLPSDGEHENPAPSPTVSNTGEPQVCEHGESSPKDAPKPKDKWDKMTALGSILLPVSLAVAAHLVASNLKDRELRAEYVKLSVDMLTRDRDHPIPEGLRLYAFNILKAQSPVSMPPGLEADLRALHLERDKWLSGRGFGGGCPLRLTSTTADIDGLYVYLDGELSAMTPATIEVSEGEHSLEFRKVSGESIASRNVHCEYNKITSLVCNPDQRTIAVTFKTNGSREDN